MWWVGGFFQRAEDRDRDRDRDLLDFGHGVSLAVFSGGL